MEELLKRELALYEPIMKIARDVKAGKDVVGVSKIYNKGFCYNGLHIGTDELIARFRSNKDWNAYGRFFDGRIYRRISWIHKG